MASNGLIARPIPKRPEAKADPFIEHAPDAKPAALATPQQDADHVQRGPRSVRSHRCRCPAPAHQAGSAAVTVGEGKAGRETRDRPKGQTLRLDRDAWRQLMMLALDDGKTCHYLVLEGIDLLFQSRSLPPIA